MRKEIIGTVFVIFFVLVSCAIIYALWLNPAIAPFWVSLVTTIIFGGISIWAGVKTIIYWCRKIKK